MAYCTNCGEGLGKADDRCPSCGEPINARSTGTGLDVEGRLIEAAVSPWMYYGAAAGLVVGCIVYLLAVTIGQFFIGLGIVALSTAVLHIEFRVLRPYGGRWAPHVIRGIWLYLLVLFMSVISTLPTVFDVSTWGLPQFTVLYRQSIGVVLLVGGVVLALLMVRLRREEGW